MINIISTAILIIGLAAPPAIAAEANRPGLSLRQTFDLYVRSVQRSDIEALFTTVSEQEDFLFLTSTGELIDTREGYRKFHEDWFKEQDWDMPVDNIEVYEGQDFGITRAIFHYRSRTPEGGTSRLDSWFTMVFRKEAGMWKAVADACTPIGRLVTEANPEITYTSEQQFLFSIMKNRRTVRKFKPTPVPREHLLKILDAARFAATAGNQQPWKFLVIEDRQKLDDLKTAALEWTLEEYEKASLIPPDKRHSTRDRLQKTLENVLSAPVYVAVLVDSRSKYADDNIHDGTLAMGNLMIAARALGYGTGFFTSFFPEARMKHFFKIPDRFNLICFTPIGIPEEWPAAPVKKSLDEVVVFEKF